jgi:hypothetical protein
MQLGWLTDEFRGTRDQRLSITLTDRRLPSRLTPARVSRRSAPLETPPGSNSLRLFDSDLQFCARALVHLLAGARCPPVSLPTVQVLLRLSIPL